MSLAAPMPMLPTAFGPSVSACDQGASWRMRSPAARTGRLKVVMWGSPESASPARRCTLFLSAKLVPGRRVLGTRMAVRAPGSGQQALLDRGQSQRTHTCPLCTLVALRALLPSATQLESPHTTRRSPNKSPAWRLAAPRERPSPTHLGTARTTKMLSAGSRMFSAAHLSRYLGAEGDADRWRRRRRVACHRGQRRYAPCSC